MSERRPLLCQECYEARDIEGTFASRMEISGVIGICTVCLEWEHCVRVAPDEATQLARRETKIMKWIGIGLVLAVLLMIAYLIAGRNYRECRESGSSNFYCVTKNFIR